jgi:hypothetical protein
MPNTPENLKPLEPGHFASRLRLPLDPEAARELNQAAGKLHQDLQALHAHSLQGLEPSMIFQPGSAAK